MSTQDPTDASNAHKHTEESALPEAAASLTAADQESAAPEKTLWTGRPNWKHYVAEIAVLTLVAGAILIASAVWFPGAFRVIFIVAIIGGLIEASRVGLFVYGTKYELTTERLFIQRGVVRLTKDQTELIRVDDVRVRQLFVERLFNLGSIDVLSTDLSHGNQVIVAVADPDSVAELIRSHMRSARKKSLFIESL